MILWMMKQSRIAADLERRVAVQLSRAHRFGLFGLVFVAILREGIETVIFLSAAGFAAGDNSLIGAVAGIAGAIVLGWAIFAGSLRVNLRKFFAITNILLPR